MKAIPIQEARGLLGKLIAELRERRLRDIADRALRQLQTKRSG
jgi:hypothetical protein